MKLLVATIVVFMSTIMIYDFSKNVSEKDWSITDDVVMGGRSNGSFSIDDDGHGVFQGTVSLENNGGFSSVRRQFQEVNATKNSEIHIRLKGDGKDYQFRIKDKSNNYFSYITTFRTSGDWQTVEIKLGDLYPSFRGRKLSLPNFDASSFEEIVFLIGMAKTNRSSWF